MDITQLITARSEIDKLEITNNREITDDELHPILHNCHAACRDYEQELRAEYKEKFPTYLNREDLDSLSIIVMLITILDSLMFEWIQYKRPKLAIKYLKTGKTFLCKSLAEFTSKLPKEDKLRLIREATKKIKESERR